MRFISKITQRMIKHCFTGASFKLLDIIKPTRSSLLHLLLVIDIKGRVEPIKRFYLKNESS